MEEEIQVEEVYYTRLMNELRDLREAKAASLEAMRAADSAETSSDLERKITNEIKLTIDAKDHMLEELSDSRRLIEEKTRKIEQFQDDLIKM